MVLPLNNTAGSILCGDYLLHVQRGQSVFRVVSLYSVWLSVVYIVLFQVHVYVIWRRWCSKATGLKGAYSLNYCI